MPRLPISARINNPGKPLESTRVLIINPLGRAFGRVRLLRCLGIDFVTIKEHYIEFIEVSTIKNKNIENLIFIILEYWLFDFFYILASSKLTGKLDRLLY